ncbi:MAG: HK97 gp10 family phage protein [Gammaproteobacteria bacterium]
MAETFRVEGVKELNRALKRFPARLQGRATRAALLAGARVIARGAKSAAPRRTGALRKNIVAKRGNRRYDKPGRVRAIVGVRHGKTRTRGRQTAYDRRGQDPFYFRFQELGYRAVGRSKRRGRKSAGRRIPGKRFLTNAARTEGRAAFTAVRDRLRTEIKKLEAKR